MRREDLGGVQLRCSVASASPRVQLTGRGSRNTHGERVAQHSRGEGRATLTGRVSGHPLDVLIQQPMQEHHLLQK